LPFDQAWTIAMASVHFPRGGGTPRGDPTGRLAWRDALEATRLEWQRCYERRPSPHAEAFRVLIGALDEDGQSLLPEPFRDGVAA
jgi:hypothetical protein